MGLISRVSSRTYRVVKKMLSLNKQLLQKSNKITGINLDFKHFIRRKQILNIYRRFIQISWQDKTHQNVLLRDNVRAEFKSRKQETDETQIKFLMKNADFQLKYTEQMLGISGRENRFDSPIRAPK